ncbi:Hypothetical protein D9617_9g024360 [Elsinoe fawcettii]|nr:Hypothetical protein D9617_9g024360 [Elsinoe fawcettii]
MASPASKLAVEPQQGLGAFNAAGLLSATVDSTSANVALDKRPVTGSRNIVHPEVRMRDVSPTAPSGFLTSVIVSPLTVGGLADIPTKEALGAESGRSLGWQAWKGDTEATLGTEC